MRAMRYLVVAAMVAVAAPVAQADDLGFSEVTKQGKYEEVRDDLKNAIPQAFDSDQYKARAQQNTVLQIDQRARCPAMKPDDGRFFRAPTRQAGPAARPFGRGCNRPHRGLKALRQKGGCHHLHLPSRNEVIGGMLQGAAPASRIMRTGRTATGG